MYLQDIQILTPSDISSMASPTPSTSTQATSPGRSSDNSSASAKVTTVKRKRAPYTAVACARCVQRRVKCIGDVGEATGACERCLKANVSCQKGFKKDTPSHGDEASTQVSPTCLTARLSTNARSASLCFHLLGLHQKVVKDSENPYDGYGFHRWAKFAEELEPALQRASGRVKELNEIDQLLAAISLLNGAKISPHSEIIGSRHAHPGPNAPLTSEMAVVGSYRGEALNFFQTDLIKKVEAFCEHDDINLAAHQFELTLRAADLIDSAAFVEWGRKARRRATLKGMALLKMKDLEPEKRAQVEFFVHGSLVTETAFSAIFGFVPQSTKAEVLAIYDPNSPLPPYPSASEFDMNVIFPSEAQVASSFALQQQYATLLAPLPPLYIRMHYTLFFSPYSAYDSIKKSWTHLESLHDYTALHYNNIISDPRFNLPPGPHSEATQTIFAGLLATESMVLVVYVITLRFLQRTTFSVSLTKNKLTSETRGRLLMSLEKLALVTKAMMKYSNRALGRVALENLESLGCLAVALVICDGSFVKEFVKESNRPIVAGLRVAAFSNPDVSRLVAQIQARIDSEDAKTTVNRTREDHHKDADNIVRAALSELNTALE